MASWGIGMTGNGRHSYRSERQCAGLEARDFDASALSMSWKRRGRFRQPPGTARPAGHAGRRAFGPQGAGDGPPRCRSEEHTSELQSLMRISYAVFCLNKKNINIILLKNTSPK